jgi:hypothetical protein
VDVEYGRVALASGETSPARHLHAALARVAPARRQVEVARVGIRRLAVEAPEDGKGAQFLADRAAGHTGHGAFRVEQRGDLPAQRFGGGQPAAQPLAVVPWQSLHLAPRRKRDARPVLTQSAPIFGTVRRRVQRREDVEEERGGVKAQRGEVPRRRVAQVGARPTGRQQRIT